MTREQIWAERVRAWRASGKSMSDFSRGKEFTASGLAYWIKRLGSPADPKPESEPKPRVRMARVVRSSEPKPEATTVVKVGREPAWDGSVVVEVLAMRAVVPAGLVGAQLDAVVASLTRGWGGGRT